MLEKINGHNGSSRPQLGRTGCVGQEIPAVLDRKDQCYRRSSGLSSGEWIRADDGYLRTFGSAEDKVIWDVGHQAINPQDSQGRKDFDDLRTKIWR